MTIGKANLSHCIESLWPVLDSLAADVAYLRSCRSDKAAGHVRARRTQAAGALADSECPVSPLVKLPLQPCSQDLEEEVNIADGWFVPSQSERERCPRLSLAKAGSERWSRQW